MEKYEFKSESKRLLDLMINSIYTNKDIFLRELISNASDAIDKYHFMSLTDERLPNSNDYEILNYLKIFREIKKDDIPNIKLPDVKVRLLKPLVNGKRI